MYRKYYGFSHKPFELTPDPDVIFLSETHQEAISVLRYGVINQKGFLQLTGKVGTGKSTLLQSLIQSLESNVQLCYIPNPNFTVPEFYYFLAAKFGLEEFDGNKAKFILSLGEFLQQCKKDNKHVLLIVDEAQVLSLDVLEEIRLISNQEFYEVYGVLSIFLVGQPEFNDLLDHQKLLPLRNRIGISFQIEPLTLAETTAYIQFRLRKAGRNTPLFSQNAYREIHQATGGIPRTINILCDNALLAGFAEQRGIIDAEIIRDCAREFRKAGQSHPASAEIPATPEKKEKTLSLSPGSGEPQKRSAFIQLQKVAMTVVALFFLFIVMGITTEYWGRLPGATPLKSFFAKQHVIEKLLLPIKKIFMVSKNKAAFSSAEKYRIPEKVEARAELAENKINPEKLEQPENVAPPEGLAAENMTAEKIHFPEKVADPAEIPEEKINAEVGVTDKKKLFLKPLILASLQPMRFLKIMQREKLSAAPIMSA